jgi:hypothetical protein
MAGGSNAVTCGRRARRTLGWQRVQRQMDAREVQLQCARVGGVGGGEVVRSRVGAAPRCVLMEVDVATGLFWCAVSHVFNFAPTTRGRREL